MMRIIKMLLLVSLICSPSSAQRCIIPGRYKDYNDLTNRQYYVCNEFGGTPIFFRCPMNSIFSALKQVCEATSNPSLVECTWIQVFLGRTPNTNGDPKTYIDCTEPSLGPRIVTCVAGLFSPIYLCCYDDKANTCYI